jgi:hypothetical protein
MRSLLIERVNEIFEYLISLLPSHSNVPRSTTSATEKQITKPVTSTSVACHRLEQGFLGVLGQVLEHSGGVLPRQHAKHDDLILVARRHLHATVH